MFGGPKSVAMAGVEDFPGNFGLENRDISRPVRASAAASQSKCYYKLSQ